MKYSADRYAGKDQGNAVIGIDHIGFIVEDPTEFAAMDQRIKDNGGAFHAEATAGQALEVKYADPHGIIFDILEPEHTWQGINGKPIFTRPPPPLSEPPPATEPCVSQAASVRTSVSKLRCEGSHEHLAIART